MTLSLSDKVVLTKYPPLPSTCCVCNFSADGSRDFIDFQMSLDYYGAVAICAECVSPVATLFGYVKESEFSDLQEQLRSVHESFEKAQEENGRLQTALDSIFSVRPHLDPNYSMPDDLASENSDEALDSSEDGS